ncbi:MAG TPA: hypothetical protein VJN91_02560 [Gammaproteobacteria bacterium]|nr:hypothetical protein [Gammaproteobacteria bacterium]
MRLRKLLVLLICLVSGRVVLADLYTFTPGTAANAEQVNANFSTLVTQIEQLQAQIAAMQSLVDTPTIESIPGTYDFVELSVQVQENGLNNYGVGGSSGTGVVVLNANGTGTVNSSDSNRMLNFFTQTKNVRTGSDTCCESVNSTSVNLGGDSSSDSGTFTWSYSGNVLTVTSDEVMNFIPAGGRIFVHRGYDASEGRNSILIVVRR